MGDTLNMVEGFINDMVSETSHMNAPTVVKDNNETTTVSILGKTKPIVVYGNNNGAMKLADTGLKSNKPLVSTWWKKKKDGCTNGLTIMTCRMITPIHLQKRMNRGAHTCSQVTTVFLNSPKPNTTGNQNKNCE